MNLFELLTGIVFAPENGAGDGGAAPGADTTGNDSAGSEPADTDGDNPNLVDITATDAQGRKLWYSWEDFKARTDEAASWRVKYQELKKSQGDSTSDTPAQDTPPSPATEQFEQRLATLEAANKRLLIQNAIIAEAAKAAENRAAFVDPADAVALVDMTAISVDDDGKIVGVGEAVTKLAETKPHLLTTAARVTNRAPNPARQDTLTMEEIQQMTPQQYLDRKDEVDKALAAIQNNT